jgi:hypothetical protein
MEQDLLNMLTSERGVQTARTSDDWWVLHLSLYNSDRLLRTCLAQADAVREAMCLSLHLQADAAFESLFRGAPQGGYRYCLLPELSTQHMSKRLMKLVDRRHRRALVPPELQLHGGDDEAFVCGTILTLRDLYQAALREEPPFVPKVDEAYDRRLRREDTRQDVLNCGTLMLGYHLVTSDAEDCPMPLEVSPDDMSLFLRLECARLHAVAAYVSDPQV